MPRPLRQKTPPAVEPTAAEELAVDDLADEQRVRQAIMDAVMSHKLPPGTRLVETPLTEAFGVNRSLLRRVFVRLASEKVIELQHNRGASIARPSQEEMREVFQVRRLIEAGVVQQLCRCAKPHHFKSLRALVAEEQQAYASGDRSRWIRLSGEYHLAAARALGNKELESILGMLVARTTLMMALYHAAGRSVCSFEEHAAIVDAMATGDAERAAALMDRHLEDAELKLRREPEGGEVDLLSLFKPG
jgi:DNA-binding GntR family transcriptional regulator